jgi:hypothetical protein
MSDDVTGVNEQRVIGEQTAPESKTESEQSRTARDFGLSQPDQQSMLVKVHAPFREYYNGDAFSISAENATGPFDILPKHHNFISLLSPCDLAIRTVKSGEQKIRISGGIMHVKANQVIVFLDV